MHFFSSRRRRVFLRFFRRPFLVARISWGSWPPQLLPFFTLFSLSLFRQLFPPAHYVRLAHDFMMKEGLFHAIPPTTTMTMLLGRTLCFALETPLQVATAATFASKRVSVVVDICPSFRQSPAMTCNWHSNAVPTLSRFQNLKTTPAAV